MLVREDKVFTPTGPLSELVWSPQKGLSSRCTDSSLAEKKGSLLWCTELFSILVSSPKCYFGTESGYNGKLAEDIWNAINLEPNSEYTISKGVTLLGSPRSSCSLIMARPIRTPGGSYCEMEELNRKEVSVLCTDHQKNSHIEIKEAGVCSTKTGQTNAYILRSDTAGSFAEKTSFSGVNGNSDDFLCCKPEEPNTILAKVDAEFEDSNKGISADHSGKDTVPESNNDAIVAEELTSGVSMFKKDNQLEKLDLVPGLTECKQAGSCLDDAKGNTNEKVTYRLACPHPPSNQGTAGVQSLDAEGVLYFQHSSLSFLAEAKNDLGEMCMVAESYPLVERKDEFLQILEKKKTTLFHSSQKENENLMIQKKGKEKVIDAEDNGSTSKGNNDSNDSVESTNSRSLLSVGKRAWSFEPDMPVTSKRLKKLNNESSCSGSLLRQESSFMNWISNVTRGFSTCRSAETPSLALFPKPSRYTPRNLVSSTTSPDKEEDMACKSMGFETIFRSMYDSSLKAQFHKGGSLDHQEESDGSREPQVADRSLLSASCNHGIFQFAEPLPVLNTSSNISPVLGKAKNQVWKGSSSFFQNASNSASEGKGNQNFSSVVPNTSSNLMTSNRSGFLGSLWVSRLSPKVSAPIIHTEQCCQDMTSANTKLPDDCNMFLPHAENGIISVKYQDNLQETEEASSENQNCASNGQLQDNNISPTDSCCSKMIKIDPKLKSKLNPILPSQRLKKSEPMASVFAKRLDAFRHIRTSEVEDGVKCASTICLFCGKSGHSIKECFEMIGSEVEDLVKNIGSYDSVEKSSCLCIRCNQLNHWAIACPYASLKSTCSLDGDAATIKPESSDMLAKRGAKIPGKHASFSNHDARIHLINKVERSQFVHGHNITHGEKLTMRTVLMAQENLVTDVDDVITSNRMVADTNPVNKDLLEESRTKEKQLASGSLGMESRENQVMPICNFVTCKIPDERTGFFERIRRLRLSRLDIVRWMKTPIPHFGLEGFYLRLRIGKCEEGLTQTGYHAASIVGVSIGTLHGNGKSQISVNMGGFKCLIDSRVVSNHDFVEDELGVWWSAMLKGGGKLPSVEELENKLKERKKFDF